MLAGSLMAVVPPNYVAVVTGIVKTTDYCRNRGQSKAAEKPTDKEAAKA